MQHSYIVHVLAYCMDTPLECDHHTSPPLCTLCKVPCIIYIVYYTAYIIHIYCVHCTMYILCTSYNITVAYMLLSIQYKLCRNSVQSICIHSVYHILKPPYMLYPEYNAIYKILHIYICSI